VETDVSLKRSQTAVAETNKSRVQKT